MDALPGILQDSCGTGISSQLLAGLIATLITAQCSLTPNYPKDIALNHAESYDFIVVGAGSAGSPLAATLSSNPNWNVLLIEAGGDPPVDSDTPYFFFGVQGKEKTDWKYYTEPQTHSLGFNNRQSYWSRGKMLGGCSSINAMIYQEGNKRDYDEWESFGNAGWGYDDVKKYFEVFRKNVGGEENLPQFESLKIIQRDYEQAIKELGFRVIDRVEEKCNGTIGYRSTLQSIKNGTRNNAARAFLEPIRSRTNLHVLKNAHVTKVLLDDEKNAKGVEVSIKGVMKKIYSTKEVILSAGAINSPQILMLSGIGKKDDLEKLQIAPVHDLPVGENLLDHSLVVFIHELDGHLDDSILDFNEATYLFLKNRTGAFSQSGYLNNFVGFINTKKDSEYPDMQYHHFLTPQGHPSVEEYMRVSNYNEKVVKKVVDANKNHDLLLTFLNVLKPKAVGSLYLKSNDPFDPPAIDPHYGESEEDTQVLVEAIKHLNRVTETEPMKKYKFKPLFDVTDFDECDEVGPDQYERCYVKYFTSTIYHPSGTTKMASGPDGVVDERLRVKGVKGLRVGDASIMPTIVSGNTNAPCIMIGKKLGDMIVEDWSEKSAKSNDVRNKIKEEL